jgi:hypothetical protein
VGGGQLILRVEDDDEDAILRHGVVSADEILEGAVLKAEKAVGHGMAVVSAFIAAERILCLPYRLTIDP